MLNTERIHHFFYNFGYVFGNEYKPISLARYKTILETARRWHDRSFASFLIGCFVGVEQDETGAYTKYALEYPEDEQILGFLREEWVA